MPKTNQAVRLSLVPDQGPKVPATYTIVEMTNIQTVSAAGNTYQLGSIITPAQLTQLIAANAGVDFVLEWF